MKVGKSCPCCCDKFSKRFSAESRVIMGIAKRAIFRESRDKCARVTTIPSINVAAYNVGGFHSRNLASALCDVERELKRG